MNKLFSYKELTFGSDPEVFASYIKGGKEFVEPAIIFRLEKGVKATKIKSPHPIFINKGDLKIIEDGVAFEFTLPPSNNGKNLYTSISRCIEMTGEIVNKFGYNISNKPVINFDCDRFNNNYGHEIIMSMIFGCDPDRDAIEEFYFPNLIDARFHPYRYGGGHFHIGSMNDNIAEFIKQYYQPFIKLLAILVGNLVIANSPYPELEKKRAEIYGRPGRFRIQKWGIEYRTPSNSWITNQELLDKMIENSRKAFILLQNPSEGRKIINELLQPTIEAIRMGNKKKSMKILEYIKGGEK